MECSRLNCFSKNYFEKSLRKGRMGILNNQAFLMGIRKMIKLYETMLESGCTEHKLSLLEKSIISFLYNNPQKNTASDIVEYRMISKANVSQGVDGLIRKGLLRREEDTKDRRRTNLYLLPKAEPITKEIEEIRHGFFHQLFSDFTENEKQTYFRLNEMLMQNMQKGLSKKQNHPKENGETESNKSKVEI